MNRKLLSISAVVSAILSIALSEVSSPNYLGLIITALVLGCLSIIASISLIVSSTSKGKWAVAGVLLPALIFTIDNIGRLMFLLGDRGFRILI